LTKFDELFNNYSIKMKILLNTIIFILTSIFCSCHDEANPSLAGCCEYPVINDSLGNTRVYIPNIFTPNGDGVNDHLYVIGDSIEMIRNFEIRDRKENIVFKVNNVPPNDYTKGWDGMVDGVVIKGLYDISVSIEATDGSIGNYKGKVCNYPCDQIEEEEKIAMKDCHFEVEYFWYTEYIPDPPIADDPGCFK